MVDLPRDGRTLRIAYWKGLKGDKAPIEGLSCWRDRTEDSGSGYTRVVDDG